MASMSLTQTLVIATLCGATVFLALPLARTRTASERIRAFLMMLAAGVLVFVFIEVVAKAIEPLEEALESTSAEPESGEILLLSAIFVVGLAIGLLGIPAIEARVRVVAGKPEPAVALRTLAILIALGLGVQNMTEGLVIGQAAAVGQVSLAWLLVMGFALQNVTEGFGVAGPLIGTRPSWRFLTVAGLLVAVPIVLGTMIGYHFTSEPLTVLFLATAAGVIVYEIAEIFRIGIAGPWKTLAMGGVFVGFLLAFSAELLFEVFQEAAMA